jgi:hypothetical protein
METFIFIIGIVFIVNTGLCGSYIVFKTKE